MSDYIDHRNPKFTPAPPQRTTIAYPINGYPTSLADSQALQALETIKETTTPVQRAFGLNIRLIPFTVAWLVLALVLAFALNGNIVLPFLLFSALMAITHYLMNRQEYEYSAAGLERHKANLAADLHERELRQNHALKRVALNSYIKHLEGGSQ